MPSSLLAERRPVPPGVLAGVAALLTLGGCRDLDPRLVELDAAGPALDACVASDGGCDAAPPACSDPDGSVAKLRDCDRSALTACETDVTENPRHCGECMQPCEGMCTGGSCQPVDRLLAENFRFFAERPGDIVAVADDYVYAITEGPQPRSVHRVSRSTGERELFLDSVDAIDSIGVGADRIYLRIGWTLWSKPHTGGSDLLMEAESVRAFAAYGPMIAWVGAFDAVFEKSVLSGEVVQLTPNDFGDLVALRGDRLAVVNASSGGYTLHARGSSNAELAEIGAGEGEPVRVEIVEDEAFVLSERGDQREVTRFFLDGGRTPLRYASNHEMVDFAADETHLYLSWKTTSYGGIDAVALDNTTYVSASGFMDAPRQLELDGLELYFVEYTPTGLSHVSTHALKQP